MYDTVVLKSPEIDIETKDKVMNFCNRYEGIDFATGELIYSFTRGLLEGSYDYRIRISVDDTDWIKENTATPVKVKSYWHLEIECSLHKLLMNHNCYGGPKDIQKSIFYLVKFLEKVMEVSLPDFRLWELEQVDVSKIYKFMDKSICKKVISNLKKSFYTRRKPMIFDTSIMFSGSTTTNKFYWKGPEFQKHDYKRIQKYINREVDILYQNREDDFDKKQFNLITLKRQFDAILEKSMRIIRFECSIKKRKLKELFNSKKIYVYMLRDGILESCANAELKKLIKEEEDMDIIRRSDLVLERLIKIYGSRQGNSLYSTWTKLVQFGEEGAKETLNLRTFQHHRKLLVECGVGGCRCILAVLSNKPKTIQHSTCRFQFLE